MLHTSNVAAIKPIYENSINGDFIWVGNTNTNPTSLQDILDGNEDTDKQMTLKHIVNKPSSDNTTYTNINFAEFCVPNIDPGCGVDSIEFAQLNWVMGYGNANYDKVTIMITDENGNIIPETKQEIEADKKQTAEGKMHSCHRSLTGYFKGLFINKTLKNNTRYRFYVANIDAKTTAQEEGYNNGTGWSLFIVFKHPLEEKHTITYYDIDELGKSGVAGSQGKDVVCDFELMENTNVIDESIKMGLSSFGSMYHIDQEQILVNNPADRKRLPLGYTLSNGTNDDQNAFRSSILYRYNTTDCGNIEKRGDEYTRAFDLQVWAVKNDKYVKSGDKSLMLTMQGANENHFVTNAVLSFGTPDIPEATLPMEVDKTDIGPDSSYTCRLYVTVGENRDGLKNVKVNIPLSEYIQSVKKLDVRFLSNDLSWGYWDVATFSTKNKEYSTNIYLNDIRNNNDTYHNNINGTNNQAGVIPQVNAYLSEIDGREKAEFFNNPSYREARMITIDFGKLVIPSTIRNRDVIQITLTLHTKPMTNEPNDVYRKTSYTSKPTKVVPQAELTTTTEKSNETSVYESSNRAQDGTGSSQGIDDYFKNLKCDGEIGNGGCWKGEDCKPVPPGCSTCGCKGVGGDQATTEGVLQRKDKDVENIIIDIKADSECASADFPDEIEIPFCDATTIRPADIYKVFLHYYGLDIDSIAKVDSCIWEQHKRDELINFAEKYGVNRSRMMNLLGDLNTLPSITSTAANYNSDFKSFLDCEAELSADSIDSIVNMKIDYSKLLMLFEKEDTTKVYQTAKYIDINKNNAESFNVEYNISESLETYAYFKSPWKNGNCNKFIKVKFVKMNTDAPIVTYKGDTIAEGETIYACLEESMRPLIIEKGHNNYDIYSDITDISGVEHHDVWLNETKRVENPLLWDLNKDNIVSSKEAGEFKIKLRKRDFLLNCFGDPLSFTLKIIDIKIDDKPIIKTEDDRKDFCQALDKQEKIKLYVEKPANLSDLDVRWYNTYEDENRNKIQEEIGVGDTIEVRADSVATFEYSAEYFKDQCPSQQDTIFITIHEMADTLKTDTMVICHGYKITENDVIDQINEWNTPNYYSTDNLFFYKYDETYSNSDSANIVNAISKDPLSLNQLLDSIDFTSGCTGKNRIEHFVVQAMSSGTCEYKAKSPYTGKDTTYKGCPGAGSIVPIKILCYDNSKPKFKGDVDSILYCTGDTPLSELNEYLEEPDEFSNGYKWAWARVGKSSLPVNSYERNEYNTITSGKDPQTSTADANTTRFTVARVDINSCVSDSNTFRIVVADAIKSFAKVGDTTSVISTLKSTLALNYCKDQNPYSNKTLPTVGYPSTDYIMEWYRKDNLTDNNDTVAKYNPDRLTDKIDIDFSHVDTTYYAIRQTTSMGCKGPWLDVVVTVFDSVREVPIADTLVMCEGESAKKINIKMTADKDLTLYTFLASDSTEIDHTKMIVDTTEGKYLASLKKNLYYGYYKNSKTGCMSESVGFNAIVNHKPLLPVMGPDTTKMLCSDGSTIDLAALFGVKVNPADKYTALNWTTSGELIATGDINTSRYVEQIDTTTGCSGEKIEVYIKAEKTIKYTPIDTLRNCSGTIVDLADLIEHRYSADNNIIADSKIGYGVHKLIGTTPQATLSRAALTDISSSKVKQLSDTLRYFIEIEDTASGCYISDTATIIFTGLPDAKPLKTAIEFCQGVSTDLEAPTDAQYTYTWLREDGSLIGSAPQKISLEASEIIKLVETDSYGCQDTFPVSINVNPTPLAPITADTTVCQNIGTLILAKKANPDAFNTTANLDLQWFNELGDSISNSVRVDTIQFSNSFKANYTLRQTNRTTQCYKDTTISITIHERPTLMMPDLAAVCEPEVIQFETEVRKYTSSVLSGSGYTYTFEKIINGISTPLSSSDADNVTHTSGLDSVAYAYTITDANEICSISDTVIVTINEKPSVPIINGGMDTIYLCKDNEPLYLKAFDTNKDTSKTEIFWGNNIATATPADSILLTSNGTYFAFAKNSKTECVSLLDTTEVIISQPIKFSLSDTTLCFGQTINLEKEIRDNLDRENENGGLYKRAIGFNVYKLNGTTPYGSATNVSALSSSSTKEKTDSTRYLIETLDTLSRCMRQDTIAVVFRNLPIIKAIDPIVICQKQDTLLPTPTTADYSYEWARQDGSKIRKPWLINFDQSETISLIATDIKGCLDTLKVSIDVKSIPEPAIAPKSTTVCQNSGEIAINASINPSTDNPASNLYLQWFSAQMDSIKTPINTDTIDVSTAQKTINYIIRQTNKTTQCYRDDTIEVRVNKALNLHIADLKAVCQPTELNVKQEVESYLFDPSSNTNLSNDKNNIKVEYSRIVNGKTNKLTEADVEAVSFAENIDSIIYIYEVTDADGICSASDSFFVTINEKPKAPTIYGGDSIFICNAGTGIYLTATDNNYNTDETDIIWFAKTLSDTHGDSLNIPSNIKENKYFAYSENINSGCKSDTVSIVATFVSSIKVRTLADIEVCEGESVNALDTLNSSFSIDKAAKSVITYSYTLDGFAVSDADLSNLSRNGQDTLHLSAVVSDALTGCNATNTLTVIFHKMPHLEVEGKTTVCQGNDVILKTIGEERNASYIWKYDANSASPFSTAATATINKIKADTTFALIGNITIPSGKNCADTIYGSIKVNETPKKLEAKEFAFCQDASSKGEYIQMNRQDEEINKFKLQWLNADTTLIDTDEKLLIAITQDTTYSILARQIFTTTDTICLGEPTKVNISINKHIDVSIADTNICMPDALNLAKYAINAKKESTTGYNLRVSDILKLDGLYTERVADSTNITESGNYRIRYADKNGCFTEADLKATFITKPDAPIFDGTMPIYLCQNIDTTLRPVSMKGDYEYIWSKAGSTETFTADSMNVETSKNSGVITYSIIRRDTIYGCESDKAELQYQILESIKTAEIDPVNICQFETIDLDSVGKTIFTTGSDVDLKIYKADENWKKQNQIINTKSVTDAGLYIVEAQDVTSKCNATGKITLNVNTPPALLFRGDTTICDKTELKLTAYPEIGAKRPTYRWEDADGNSVTDSTIAYIAKLSSDQYEAEKDTLFLTGTYKISNTKECSDTRRVVVTINPIPETLSNDTIDVCQNTTANNININYQDKIFDLKIYDSEQNSLPKIDVNTTNVANYTYTIMQEDRNTHCQSKEAKIFVNVRSAIALELDSISPVCAPATINLEKTINESTSKSNSNIIEAKKYEIGSISKSGITPADIQAIDESGLYVVVIKDQYGCEASDAINIVVNKQPETISFDTTFCQNTGVHTLAGRGSGNDLRLEWLDLDTAYPDSIFTDSLKVNTDIAKTLRYLVRQSYTASGCPSQTTPMQIDIKPAVTANLADTTVCFGTTFDFISFADGKAKGGDTPRLTSYERVPGLLPLDFTQIAQEGTFVAHYTDANGCIAADTMNVKFTDEIKLTIKGTEPVCQKDTIKLSAEGAEHYVWNSNSADIDSIRIATTTDGEEKILLTASIIADEVTKAVCSKDTLISVTVNKVPDLITDRTDTTYCQDSQTAPLTLTETIDGAEVLWYDPNDNYTTAAKNGSIKPSSVTDGEYIYKFRQLLGNCFTDYQEYTVSIQKAIEETPMVRDTAYCTDEEAAPIVAKWINPQYTVVWTDAEGNEVAENYVPQTNVAGQQDYVARLKFRACLSQPASMTVKVMEPYNAIPDVDDSFIFCQNTGNHKLMPNTLNDGVRLNWYEGGSSARKDSITINTNTSLWKTKTYNVTQSELNGCESKPKEVLVTIADEIKPRTMNIDTCANTKFTLGHVMSINNIKEEADSLWIGTNKETRMDLGGNLGVSGTYQFSVINEFGCRATNTIIVDMLEVEDFTVLTIDKIYCYDDTLTLVASSSNSTIEWDNITTGEKKHGNIYAFKLNGFTNVSLIATITSKPVCKDTLDYAIETYNKTEAIIDGKTNACIGDTIKLTAANLFQTTWSVADSSVYADDLSYVPARSEIVTVSGVDENKCPVSQKISINTVKIPDPRIAIQPEIHSDIYHLNRDTFDVYLEAKISATLDENYSYIWEFGDGTNGNSSSELHSYPKEQVRLIKDIPVKLTVEHAYGCSGVADTLLLIDPLLDIPNTMTAEDTFMEDYELQIYDRIGNLIYEGIGWKGQKSNGEEAFEDTYFYAITYHVHGGDKKVRTGYITLIR